MMSFKDGLTLLRYSSTGSVFFLSSSLFAVQFVFVFFQSKKISYENPVKVSRS